MQLNLHPNRDGNYVRALHDDRVQIGETTLTASFLVGRDLLDSDWPVRRIEDLDQAAAEALMAHDPEVILIGTGERLVFPDRRFLFRPQAEGIGVEVMDNRAACRTFNVLVAEERRVLMGLILG